MNKPEIKNEAADSDAARLHGFFARLLVRVVVLVILFAALWLAWDHSRPQLHPTIYDPF